MNQMKIYEDALLIGASSNFNKGEITIETGK
jgi:hypothetical protein